MLSALSVAELWRKEAARLAARSRLRASCRCRSTESRERSFTGTPRPREGFFGIGGGTFFSSYRGRDRGLVWEWGPTRLPSSRLHCREGLTCGCATWQQVHLFRQGQSPHFHLKND